MYNKISRASNIANITSACKSFRYVPSYFADTVILMQKL